MKKLNKFKGMYALLVAVAACIGITIYGSCSADEDFWGFDEEYISTENTRAEKMDMSEYLTLSTYDFKKWEKEDWDTFIKASIRLTVSVQKDGHYLICEKSGKEVNISEELYNTIKQGYNNSNKLIAQNSKRIPRRKSSSNESNNPVNSPQTDCVGEAIAHYLNIDTQYVNDSLAKVFPTYAQNGIHRDSLLDAVKLFKRNASKQSKFVESDPVNTTYIDGIAAISGHAVNTVLIHKIANYYEIMLLDYKNTDVYIFKVKTYYVPSIDYQSNIKLIFQYIK